MADEKERFETKTGKKRVQIDMTPSQQAEVERVMDLFGCATVVDAIRRSISVILQLEDKRTEGFEIDLVKDGTRIKVTLQNIVIDKKDKFRTKTGKKRVQIDMTPSQQAQVERVRQLFGCAKISNTIRRSISVMLQLGEKRAEGFEIELVKEGARIKVIMM